MAPAIDTIRALFSGIGDAISDAFKAGNFSSVYDALNTGLLAGIALAIRKFFSNGLKLDFGGGLGAGIKDTFDALTSSLTALQTNIQSRTLLTIAGAIALLTASVVALSLIDSKKLSKASDGYVWCFRPVARCYGGSYPCLRQAGFIRVPMIAGAMILLATAVLILTAAVRNLSSLSWEELGKGLAGVGALLLMIVGVSHGLSGASGAIMRTGLAMIPLAIGLLILSKAVKSFSNMKWGEMAKGLTALAGSLTIIAVAMNLMPPNMLLTAAGSGIVALALNGIALALKSMGGMSWEGIAKSLVYVGRLSGDSCCGSVCDDRNASWIRGTVGCSCRVASSCPGALYVQQVLVGRDCQGACHVGWFASHHGCRSIFDVRDYWRSCSSWVCNSSLGSTDSGSDGAWCLVLEYHLQGPGGYCGRVRYSRSCQLSCWLRWFRSC